MSLFFGLDLVAPGWESAVVSIGTYDGVHRGHQRVIGRAIELAAERDVPSIVLTFDRHPLSVLAPERCPSPIGSMAQNLVAVQKLGASAVVVLPFTAELASTPAEQFFQEVLVDKLRASAIVMGHDFAFGNRRQGTPEWLAERIETMVEPPHLDEGIRISSSLIRQSVLEGKIEEANKWLGRPFALEGIVGPGDKLGRELGYPTANLVPLAQQVTPADGVYAGYATTPFGRFLAAISVGVRPTVGEDLKLAIEAHLLDYPGSSLYGRAMEVQFCSFVRGQAKLNSLDELQALIKQDLVGVRKALA